VADPGRIAGVVIIPNCIQLRLFWTQPNTKTVYNVMHGSVAGGFSATTAIADAIFTALKAAAGWTSWKARVNSGVSLAGVDLRDMRTANMPVVASTTAAAPGTGVGGALPPGDAFVVTLRTAFAGRGFRGRVYLPGLDLAALAAGGVAAAGTLTDAVSFVTAIQTAATASGITLGIAQPARQQYTGHNGVIHAARAATIIQPLTGIVARNNIIDHQRKRAGRS
jgi:hypothetical protein